MSKAHHKSHYLAPLLGFLIWLLVLDQRFPYSIFALSHVEILLLAAPLCLLPMAWLLLKHPSWLIWLGLFCGLIFTTGYHLPQGPLAASLIVPSFMLATFLSLQQLKRSKILQGRFTASSAVVTAGYLYLPVAMIWAGADRLGHPLMGYSPSIVLLTAVHFHYAGFLLPVVTRQLLRAQDAWYAWPLSIGIILGIPLVAAGISATHFSWPFWIEIVCVTVMASAGIGVGFAYLGLMGKVRYFFQKCCFALGGFALIIGMLLALAYGWRHVFTFELLTIPWMYAVHGTCNAIGFATPVLLGWLYADQ